GDVAPGTPGGASELRAGDEIIAVDGSSTQTWQDVRIALLNRMGESGSIRLDLRREDSSLTRSTSLPIQSWLADEIEPDVLGSLGILPWHMVIPPVLDEVLPGGRAEAAGLLAGD